MKALLLAIVAVWFVEGRPQQSTTGHQHGDEVQVHVEPRDINIINEPSCEELKDMWRFSKRQARTPEIINEITKYEDPFNLNQWSPYYSFNPPEIYSSSRSVGGPTYKIKPLSRPSTVYGRVINKAPLSSANHYGRGAKGYDQVRRYIQGVDYNNSRRPTNILRFPGGGNIPSQTGRFQHLKEIIRTERARELQQQRAAEELAARAAALKDMAAGQSRPKNDQSFKLRNSWGDGYGEQYTQDPDRYYQADQPKNDRNEGVIAYPNLLAPPSRRNGGGINYLDSYFFEPHPRDMLFYDSYLDANLLDDHNLMRADSEHNVFN